MLTLEARREFPTNKEIEDYLINTGWNYVGIHLSPDGRPEKRYKHRNMWVHEHLYLPTYVQEFEYMNIWIHSAISSIAKCEKVDELTAYERIMKG